MNAKLKGLVCNWVPCMYTFAFQFLLHFKVTQMSTMTITSAMTIWPIATQTPMKTIFGQNSCFVFWLANHTYTQKLITSGVGMAVYRFLCLHFYLKQNLNTKETARKILIVEWIVTAGIILTFVICFNMFGWEKAIYYQFCMDMGEEQVKTLHQHKIEEYNDVLYKALRTIAGVTIRFFILLELLIYLWIIYHLWTHDKENEKEKIITVKMREQRNQKNIVTLKGQMITFVVEMLYSTYLAVHNVYSPFGDASIVPIMLIVVSTTISVVQLMTSHEMMRFIKRHFY